ncbi:MAG: ester cyclase [Ferruginibacter sp.]
MKNFLTAFCAYTICMLISCDNNKDHVTTESSTENVSVDAEGKARLDAFNTISTAFKTGDVSKVDNVVAEDFIDHTDRGDVNGRDSLKAMIVMMHEKMKDGKTEVVNQAVNGEYVYSCNHYTGTSDGSMGMPAGPYDMKAIELVKYNSDNKATEHWAFMETQDMMKMMPPPAKK